MRFQKTQGRLLQKVFNSLFELGWGLLKRLFCSLCHSITLLAKGEMLCQHPPCSKTNYIVLLVCVRPSDLINIFYQCGGNMILLLTTIKQIPFNFSNIFISRFVSPPESHGRDIKFLFTLDKLSPTT